MVEEAQKPTSERVLDYENAIVPVGSVVANPRNPRHHPPEQIAKLVASIRRFGQTVPVFIRRENRMIIKGHGITEAMRAACRDEMRVVLLNVDQPTADALMVADNRLAQLGKDDETRIKELLREVGIADPESLGFSAAEIDGLLAEAADEIDVVEVTTSKVEDRFWISIRGPLQDQAAALQRTRQVMQEFSGIEVELGTVSDG